MSKPQDQERQTTSVRSFTPPPHASLCTAASSAPCASLCTAASSAPCASLCFCAACTAPEEAMARGALADECKGGGTGGPGLWRERSWRPGGTTLADVLFDSL
ncbi:hypothetical protein BDA96_10G205300 [Sorghum bicolor]|uniref:Uncharacterized protein n=2 Tax=Sorghum bicolor TaxID=4558 RepID=A0A921U1K2_SORBI|nr:hypothetical protein BDA96_10G205300 [Sorghum bicolor]KXG20115.1 hypothetical protein SORBI_3010G157000 [Sorghum bicolor]